MKTGTRNTLIKVIEFGRFTISTPVKRELTVNELFIDKLLLFFLLEDTGIIGDLTTASLPDTRCKAEVLAGEDFVLCGLPFFERVFTLHDKDTLFKWFKAEGSEVEEGDVIGCIETSAKTLLTCERTALNVLQRLSGVATQVRRYVKALEGSKICLLDTRKTTPGLRCLEKYAVRVGGAKNHRFGLYDAVIVKDNHIKLYGGVAKAVKAIRNIVPVTTFLEVEVENWQELEEVVDVLEHVDMVMLDNWQAEDVPRAVRLLKSKKPSVKVELSGGITFERLKELRSLPVDYISTSKVVTQARWVDIKVEVVSSTANLQMP